MRGAHASDALRVGWSHAECYLQCSSVCSASRRLASPAVAARCCKGVQAAVSGAIAQVWGSCTVFCSLLEVLVSYRTLADFLTRKNASCDAYAAVALRLGCEHIPDRTRVRDGPALGTAGAAGSTLGSPPDAVDATRPPWTTP